MGMMSIQSIDEAVSGYGVRPASFWAEAMGGDRAPMEPREVARILVTMTGVARGLRRAAAEAGDLAMVSIIDRALEQQSEGAWAPVEEHLSDHLAQL